MWFRRLFRRRRRPPPFDLSGLDRLEELVARVAALLEDVPAPPAGGAVEAVVAPAREEPVPGGCVLFVAGPDGYRLLERETEPPARGDRIELEGVSYCVLRLGPSPLPDDGRRCAFLER